MADGFFNRNQVTEPQVTAIVEDPAWTNRDALEYSSSRVSPPWWLFSRMADIRSGRLSPWAIRLSTLFRVKSKWAAIFSPTESGIHHFTTWGNGPKWFSAINLALNLKYAINFFTQEWCSEVSRAWKDSPKMRSPMISNEAKLYQSEITTSCEPLSAILTRSWSRLTRRSVCFRIRGSCFFSARSVKAPLKTLFILWWSSVLLHVFISCAFVPISGIIIFGLGR